MKTKLVTVYRGPMFSGKTKRLVEEYGGGVGILAFRPAIDNRYGSAAKIYSKDGPSAEAIFVDHTDPSKILEQLDKASKVRKVIVDEISFFPEVPFVAVVSALTDQGIAVVLGGLDYDAQRAPWGPALALVQMPGVTDIVLTARCDGDSGNCATSAIWSYRKKAHEERLVVAGVAVYGAACDLHYPDLHQRSVE